MLSPLPKSMVISPGTPRKACITRRWTFSFTGNVLEQFADRLRSVRGGALQELGESARKSRRKLIHRLEERQQEFLCALPMHEVFVRSGLSGSDLRDYVERSEGVKPGTGGLSSRRLDAGKEAKT